jgi:hypothetical protein
MLRISRRSALLDREGSCERTHCSSRKGAFQNNGAGLRELTSMNENETAFPLACASWFDSESGSAESALIEGFGLRYRIRVGTMVRIVSSFEELECALKEVLPSDKIGEAVRALLLAQHADNMGPWT